MPDTISSFPIQTKTVSEAAGSIRDGLELLSPVVVGHDEAIVHFMDQLIDLKLATYPADGKYLVVGGGGDSMGTSSGFNPYVCMELTRRFGAGAIASETFQGANSFGSGQFATTITPNNLRVQDNFQYLPNGDYYAIPAGGTFTEIPGSANIHAGFVRVRCWYAFRTGGGTITMTVTQNGVSLTPVVVNTSAGAAGSIGYTDFVLATPNGKPTLVVTSAGGTAHYLGTYFYLSKGFVPVSVGRGGSSYAQQLTGLATNINTFCEAMSMRLCFHAVKEEDTSWANMMTMMDRWATQHPKCSHVWVGATPSPDGEGVGLKDLNSNAAMRAKALALKMCFIDGQRLLRSTTYLRTIGSVAGYGWNEPPSDGNGNNTLAPHLSQVASRFIASYILNKVLLGLNTAGERFDKTLLSPESMGRPMDLGTQSYQAVIWAWTMSNVGTNSFTQTSPDLGRMTITVPAGTPAANSGAVGRFLYQSPQLNNRQVYAYRISDGALIDNLQAVIMVGGANQNDAGLGMTSNNFGGIRIIHGVDTISSTLVPWVRLAVKGVGTSEQLSPKIYHSSATGAAPYNGGTWRNTENFYWVEYIGNGTSTMKRLRVWHQPVSNGSSESRLSAPRMIADWSATITLGHNQEAGAWFGVVSNSTPSSTGAQPRVVSLHSFSVDVAPRENIDLGMPDLNY